MKLRVIKKQKGSDEKMGQLVIGLFGVVILAIIALVIVGSSLRFPLPTQTTPPPSTKSNPESSPSPILNPFPTKGTSPIASLPPSPVKPSAEDNSCIKEPNGSTVNIGSLDGSCIFPGTVTSSNPENHYRFKIDNPSNISLFLDGVNSEVEIYLYSDKDGTGVIQYTLENISAFKSKTGRIVRELGVGSYIAVVKMKARDTQYLLQIVNNTSLIQNLGYLDAKPFPKNGSISLNNREQFYRFQLANPSSISLSLTGVNSEVEMSLYSERKETEVIGYTLEYISAYNSKPGIIKKELGAGNYIVVVRLKARETNYTLTMSAP